MFTDRGAFKYTIGKNRSLHDANPNLKIKKLKKTEDCKYILLLLPPSLELKLRNKSRQFQTSEFGEIIFTIPCSEIELDFIEIKYRAAKQNRDNTNIKATLIIRVCKEKFEYKESMNFIVIIQTTNSINGRKNKFILDVNVPGDNFYNAFQNNIEQESLSRSFITNISVNDDIFEYLVAEDISPAVEDKIVKESTCLVINCIDFMKSSLKKRHQSIFVVNEINILFGSLKNCRIKGIFNPSKEEVLEIIKEITGQYVIYVMTHGDNDGFHTYDDYVLIKEFLSHLKRENLRIALILAYCQETNQSLRPFYELSNSSSDEDNEENKTVLNNLMHMKDKDKLCINNFVTNNPNIFIAIAAQPGSFSYVGSAGSYYVNEILKIMKKTLEKEGKCNFLDIIKDSSKKVKEIPLKYKGIEARQDPWYDGSLENFMLYSKEENLTVAFSQLESCLIDDSSE